VLGIILGVAALLWLVWAARGVLTWVFVAIFLALALNPAVEWLQARGLRRRWAAAGATYVLTLAAIAGLSALFIPTLVDQVNDFADAVPQYVEDLTEGRGRLGFLQEKYHIVDRVRDAIDEQGASGVLGLSGTALAATREVITIVVAVVTIAFMTFFMLLEGPGWIERFYALLPEGSQERWRRVGREIYRTVGGYVTGNLLISLLAGVLATIVLFAVGSEFAIALGLLVAILDLVPLAGATLAAIVVSTVVFIETDWLRCLIVIAFFIAYQQFENHVVQPLVYGRTVQLSPLAVLCAVLVGAQLAGILGALLAIPVAGSLLAIAREVLQYREEVAVDRPEIAGPAGG
jgi:predicted PurR-regulated permease PerM